MVCCSVCSRNSYVACEQCSPKTSFCATCYTSHKCKINEDNENETTVTHNDVKPPAKRTGVAGLITGFFSSITREAKEQQQLESIQLSRKREELKKLLSDTVISKVIQTRDKSNVDENIPLVFAQVVDSLYPIVTQSSIKPPVKVIKLQVRRPDNWQEIALHFLASNKLRHTIHRFQLLSMNPSNQYWRTTINRWAKDYSSGKTDLSHRPPVYGMDIDNELADMVRNYNNHGVPVTNFILRLNLLSILKKHKRLDILNLIVDENVDDVPKGYYRFITAWAQRFYTRHDFASRVASTKMRDETPKDYEEKKDKFILHLSKAIHDFNIPDSLIANGDETNTQFVPSVKRTRCATGTRRVRVIGIGHEKPQITVTISCAANGNIIEPTQLIFGG